MENKVSNFDKRFSMRSACSTSNFMEDSILLPVLDQQSFSWANHSGKAPKSSSSSLLIRFSKSLLTGLLCSMSSDVLLNCTTPITSPSLYCTHHNALELKSTISIRANIGELTYALNSLVLMSHSIPLLRNSPVMSMWYELASNPSSNTSPHSCDVCRPAGITVQ